MKISIYCWWVILALSSVTKITLGQNDNSTTPPTNGTLPNNTGTVVQPVPPQIGEYQTQINIVLSFKDTNIATFLNYLSPQSIVFFNIMLRGYLSQPIFNMSIRLTNFTINPPTNGVGVANVSVTLASALPLSLDQMSPAFLFVSNAIFGSNVVVVTTSLIDQTLITALNANPPQGQSFILPPPGPIAPPLPPQNGEYQTLAMGSFSLIDPILNNVLNYLSSSNLGIFNPLFQTYLAAAGMPLSFRVTNIAINQTQGSNGTRINMTLTIASVTQVSNFQINSAITLIATAAFGSNAAVVSSTILSQSIINSSNSSGAPNVTPLPPQVGEYQYTVVLLCLFPDQFDKKYEKNQSPEFNEYAKTISQKLFAGFARNILIRLVQFTPNSFSSDNGNVLANITITLASTILFTDVQINQTVIATIPTIFASGTVVKGTFVLSSYAVTTTLPSVTVATPSPPRIGEYQTRLIMICVVTDTFDSNYLNNTSPQYIAYSNSLAQKINVALQNNNIIRLTYFNVNQISQSNNTNVNMSVTLASSILFTELQINQLFGPIAIVMFGPNVNISSITILDSYLVTASAAPTTTTLSTTTTLKTTTTLSPTTTTQYVAAPERPGEIVITISMGCSFKDQYYPEYRNPQSTIYLSYTNNLYLQFAFSFRRRGLMRLLRILFHSLYEGSVVANMSMVTGSNTTLTTDQINGQVTTVTSDAFGNSATIQSLSVISQNTVTEASTTNAPALQPWGIALIVIASIVVAIGISFGIIVLINHLRTKDGDLVTFLGRSGASESLERNDQVLDEWGYSKV